jgi:hypothetical protein
MTKKTNNPHLSGDNIPARFYQRYLIRVYPKGKPRKTVSALTLPKVICPIHAVCVFIRANDYKKETKFTHVIAGYGKVVCYPVRGY